MANEVEDTWDHLAASRLLYQVLCTYLHDSSKINYL